MENLVNQDCTNSSQMDAACSTPLILVIDDESSIRRSLEGVLSDEGFRVALAEDGTAGLGMISELSPAAILLDIWMPGIDGIETLKQIKSHWPNLPVIMISGHAAISTAMSAIKLGASDFIEKPLDLVATVSAVRRVLEKQCSEQPFETEVEQGDYRNAESKRHMEFNKIVFDDQCLRGKLVTQRTLARSAIVYGQGLHSGKKSGLILEPLPANSGIHFVDVSEDRPVPAHINFVASTGFATTVKADGTQVGTIEHLMSALHAYGITNLLIKCNGEVPVLDGSSREFCRLFDDVGTEEQTGEWYAIKPTKTIRVTGKGDEFIQLEPADEFSIDYTLRYPKPLGDMRMVFTLGDLAKYRDEISPARTFGFVKDIGFLQRQGYALGGRFDNFVLFGESGPINDKLRFPDEPVRHKILDAIGDLYMLGRPIHGKITASMTGHSDNIQLLKELMNSVA